MGRTGHLQPAAELLHRSPAGGHRIAQQEHRDAPLLNQPPQHRILSISGPATEWKGARNVSSESPSPRTTPRPLLACFQIASSTSRASPKLQRKKKKKLSLKPLSTYLFRNQLLQLCFCQATQAKGTKKGKKLRDAFSEIITKMKWFYICINDEQRVYASPTAMSNQSGRAFSCVRGAGLTHS